MQKKEVVVFWFRRDLRLEDNSALYSALQEEFPVLSLFIFDEDILNQLPNRRDKRVVFIHQSLEKIWAEFKRYNSSLLVKLGNLKDIFSQLSSDYSIKAVYTNHDYEPYAIERDLIIRNLLAEKNIAFYTYKDQVVFERSEILKSDGNPYTIFTPYSKIWKQKFQENELKIFSSEKYLYNLLNTKPFDFPSLEDIGFENISFDFPSPRIDEHTIHHYAETRNIPSIEGTSYVSLHLRFGTISVRYLVSLANKWSETWLNELIWREFFMMILFHFPKVIHHSFKQKYEFIKWRNNENEFALWCEGKTGFPIVDAGMRELNETGFMHNRVRMIVAGFLTKNLLIDWRWGEAYFAEKLLDYELSSNNGNWQWAAGCGCDAAPYFRIFNPTTQIEKFDPQFIYIKKWVPEFDTDKYPKPIVEYKSSRHLALKVYKEAVNE